METIIIQCDNHINIRFQGRLIAKVSSSPDWNRGNMWSRENGRWSELALYHKDNGNFVCEYIHRTAWHCEKDTFNGFECEFEESVIEFFGRDWLAMILYHSAGIHVPSVD